MELATRSNIEPTGGFKYGRKSNSERQVSLEFLCHVIFKKLVHKPISIHQTWGTRRGYLDLSHEWDKVG